MGIALLQHNVKGHPSKAAERDELAVLATAANPIRIQNQSAAAEIQSRMCRSPPLLFGLGHFSFGEVLK